MLEYLKLRKQYLGFIFLADAARNPPILRSHHHTELELNLVIRGSITYVAGGRRYSFGKRSMVWMFPTQEHQLVDRSHDAQYYVAVFKPELITDACTGSRYKDLRQSRSPVEELPNGSVDPRDFEQIRSIMDSVVEEGLDPDLLNREAGFGVSANFRFEHSDPDKLNAGLRYLLLRCWRDFRKRECSPSQKSLHPAVMRALDILGGGARDIKLPALSRRCGVSSPYLSRIFQREMGLPINRYRNAVRISHFLELYRRPPHKTLAETVFAAGFGSYAQFYKIFTSTYGVGPRKLLSNNS